MKGLENTLSAVLEAAGISQEEWEANKECRERRMVIVKSLFCYISRKEGYTLQEIGRAIGLRHATVIYHNNIVADSMDVDMPLKKTYLRAKSIIESRV